VGVPENMANHIYYEINPEYRGKGYGKKILTLGLEKAQELGLDEIYITCMEDNLASKKIIEANGGVFVQETMILSVGKKMLKYKIILNI
jgi:predicted acetyltransferase